MASFKLFGGTNPGDVAGPDSVAVIGLGRFGRALALELMSHGTDVLGIDQDESVVQSLNGRLTHVAVADVTSEEVLRQLAVDEFDHVVIAIASNLEASILVTSLMLQFNIPELWAKAVSEPHRAILQQLGVRHIVFPEQDMGRRVAHMVRGSLQDYILIDEDFALAKTTPHQEILGRELGALDVRRRHGVTITAVKHARRGWEPATAQTVLAADDIILVSGPAKKTEGFRRLR
ncbi:potassium channel family protein [Nesterenkonia jeotgali]|uniref:Potassium transporter n=1 Tax=Nesterenkonia jeotgali TaxID=317018 RepID=A0A0W8IKZ9_9MICC|nr:TrkA family potassium uptake protein [Nesterenkonia jeotgali]KUG60649.1 potassium transporter [Nesterenkonia jeotgali]